MCIVIDTCCTSTNKRTRYMFHQANMRVNDVPTTTVNGKRDRFSLLMTWVETVTAEMMRLQVQTRKSSVDVG